MQDNIITSDTNRKYVILIILCVVSCFAAISYFSLIPMKGTSRAIEIIDNILHAPGYAVLTILSFFFIKHTFNARDVLNISITGIISVGFGVLIEFLQSNIPGREKSVIDMCLNSTGFLLGVAAIYLWRQRQKAKPI